jgi:hypothetical protein
MIEVVEMIVRIVSVVGVIEIAAGRKEEVMIDQEMIAQEGTRHLKKVWNVIV